MVSGSNLGIGLTPDEANQKAIFALADKIASNFETSYVLREGSEIPHLTLFKGTFKSESSVIERLKTFDLSSLRSSYPVVGIGLWDSRIVFLDFLKLDSILSAHTRLFEMLFPMALGTSTDPRAVKEFKNFKDLENSKNFNSFKNSTASQEASRPSAFEIQFPFSLRDYHPHITLAHLNSSQQDPISQTSHLNTLLKDSAVSDEVDFDKLAVYRASPFGAMRSTVLERELIPAGKVT